MPPEGDPAQIMLSVTFPEYEALHEALSVVSTIASSRLGLVGPASCKTTKIGCKLLTADCEIYFHMY
jgi:hypothetical protein